MKNIIIIIFLTCLSFATQPKTIDSKEPIVIDSYELYKLQLFHNYPILLPNLITDIYNLNKDNNQTGMYTISFGYLAYIIGNFLYSPVNIFKTPFVMLTIIDNQKEDFPHKEYINYNYVYSPYETSAQLAKDKNIDAFMKTYPNKYSYDKTTGKLIVIGKMTNEEINALKKIFTDKESNDVLNNTLWRSESFHPSDFQHHTQFHYQYYFLLDIGAHLVLANSGLYQGGSISVMNNYHNVGLKYLYYSTFEHRRTVNGKEEVISGGEKFANEIFLLFNAPFEFQVGLNSQSFGIYKKIIKLKELEFLTLFINYEKIQNIDTIGISFAFTGLPL